MESTINVEYVQKMPEKEVIERLPDKWQPYCILLGFAYPDKHVQRMQANKKIKLSDSQLSKKSKKAMLYGLIAQYKEKTYEGRIAKYHLTDFGRHIYETMIDGTFIPPPEQHTSSDHRQDIHKWLKKAKPPTKLIQFFRDCLQGISGPPIPSEGIPLLTTSIFFSNIRDEYFLLEGPIPNEEQLRTMKVILSLASDDRRMQRVKDFFDDNDTFLRMHAKAEFILTQVGKRIKCIDEAFYNNPFIEYCSSLISHPAILSLKYRTFEYLLHSDSRMPRGKINWSKYENAYEELQRIVGLLDRRQPDGNHEEQYIALLHEWQLNHGESLRESYDDIIKMLDEAFILLEFVEETFIHVEYE